MGSARHAMSLLAVLVSSLAGCGGENAGGPALPTTLVRVGGDSQSTNVGQTLPNPLVVRVADGNGSGMPGVRVAWSVTSGGGSLSAVTATTDAVGAAAVTWTLGPTVGTQEVSASVAGAPQIAAVTFSATAAPGPAAKLVFTVQPTNVTATMAITPAVQVTVQDGSGNAVTTAHDSITVAITSGTGTTGAVLGGRLTVAPVNGVATFSTLTLDKAGTGYTLTAKAAGLTSAVSDSFRVTVAAGAAAHLVFAVEPPSTPVGLAFGVQVLVLDAAGNTVTSSSASITLAITSGTGAMGATLGGTLTQTAVAGVATFSNLTLDKAGTYSLTAMAPGLTSAISATFSVMVPFYGEFAIVAAQWTQGTQDSAGSIPMVLGGDGAVVNVIMSASRAVSLPMQLLLRLTDAASGTAVRSDTITLTGLAATTPGFDAPTAQFYVPSSVLRAGLKWELVRDPKGLLPDTSVANDHFPPAGPAPVPVVNVTPLKVRFIPIVLSSQGNATGQVSAANTSAYLQTLRSVQPVGALQVTVGSALTSAANFGTPPNGGAAAFWQQVLGEVDLARLADPANVDVHWIGVVAPPAGFTNTAYGGFGYIPTSYASTAGGTKSAVLVNVGWFNNPTQTRDLVAHELGHNFGREHAPCGSPAPPIDPAFPNANGTIGAPGHDVYRRFVGATTTALTIPASTGDVMGYCFPLWSSAYTYEAVLDFRGTSAASPPPRPAVPVLVVRGAIAGGVVSLQPAVVITAVPSVPAPGPYALEGLSEDGSVLFHYSFEPARLDHSLARPFLFTIPLTDVIDHDLQTIRVSRGGISQTLSRRVPIPGAPVAAQVAPAAAATTGGAVRLTCDAAGTRAIAVQDARTGALLGTSEGAAMDAIASAGTPLVVTCSDGIRSRRTALVAP